jgi:hypothetical protein
VRVQAKRWLKQLAKERSSSEAGQISSPSGSLSL